MEPQDIEQVLKSAKFRHLSEATLVSYRDQDLDEIGLALANAHLRLCAICENRLNFLKQEEEAIESYTVTERDSALIHQAIDEIASGKRELGLAPVQSIGAAARRLSDYFKELQLAWVMQFSEPMRGTADGDQVFRHQSPDGRLTTWATLEKDASLTVFFESNDLSLKGARVRFRLGSFSRELILQQETASTVSARVEIPRRDRTRTMADFSIEVIGPNPSPTE